MTFVQALVIVALIVWTLARRFVGQQLQARRMIIIPAILTVWAVWQLDGVHSTTPEVVLLGVQAAISIGLGGLRGMSIRVYLRDGVAWFRYRWLTIGLWLVTIAVRVVFAVATGALNPAASDAGIPSLLVGLGVGLLAEAGVVVARVAARGLPLAERPQRQRARRRSQAIL
jgi:hypothetical protein